MLQIIRDRAHGVIAWIIVGMIIIPFALWGINSYFGASGDDSVAEVGGVKISQRQLQNEVARQRQRLQEMFGGKLPENLFSEETMKRQVMEQLIDREVILQAAGDSGIRISDAQLTDLITGIEAFQVDGKFSNEQYERLLAQQGMSPRLFEQRVRRDLLASQFMETVTASEFALPGEVDAALRLSQQQRHIGYLLLPLTAYQAKAEATDEEVQKYYAENSARYLQPEQVKIDYLELKAADIASAITVQESELRERYEAQKINYRTPEERKASHILVAVSKDATEEEVNAARQKAEALLARIRGGEEFAAIAKAESADPGSAKQGGDLGFFGRGVMDPAFEATTFSLAKGEMSEPVRSAFGFHLIRLDDVRGGETKSFEQVQAQIRQEIQNERAEQIFYDKAEQLANLTYEQPDTLKVAAEQLQLEIKTSPFFGRSGGQGIAANPKVSSAAFSDDVLARSNNSESLDLGNNHLVVLRINEHRPEAQRPLEEVKAGIVSAIKHDKALTQAREAAAELLAKVRGGESAAELAKVQGLEWKEQDALARESSEVDHAIVQAAFRMPQPAQGGHSSEQVALASGDQAIVVLYAVTPGDAAAASAEQRNDAQQGLLQADGSSARQAVMDALRSKAEITSKLK